MTFIHFLNQIFINYMALLWNKQIIIRTDIGDIIRWRLATNCSRDKKHLIVFKSCIKCGILHLPYIINQVKKILEQKISMCLIILFLTIYHISWDCLPLTICVISLFHGHETNKSIIGIEIKTILKGCLATDCLKMWSHFKTN